METVSALPRHEDLRMSSRSVSAGQSDSSTLQEGCAHCVHDGDSWLARQRADGFSRRESPMDCTEPSKCCSSCEDQHTLSQSQSSSAPAAELVQLRIRQHQLECKNSLLEKLLHMKSRQKQPQAGWLDPSWGDCFPPYKDTATAAKATDTISISVCGQRRMLTVQDVSQLSMGHFAEIWSAYISKIVGYLLQLRSVEGGALKGTIEQTTSECVKLILCVCVVNPTVLIGATQGRVDEVLATKTKLDTVFQLTCLRQLNLSEPQIQDILYIRRLYHTRRGMLQAQRQAHISKICANKSVHPHQDFGHLADLADGLKAAALQDCKLYHNVGHALAWGILSRMQAAIWIVHLYPYIPILEDVLEALAMARYEPSREDLMATSNDDPMTAEWAEFEEYVEGVIAQEPCAYVPVPRQAASSSVSGSS